jgi:type I restriction enzyme S subunit
MEIEIVKNDVGMKWEMVRLSNVAEIIAGQSPESKYYNDIGEGIPFFQGKADFRVDYPIVRYWCTQPTKIAKPMDILMSVRAPVGPTNICDIEACIGRGLAAVRAGKKLHYKYLYFYFKTIEEKLASQGNGSTFSAITTSVIKDLQIPLPPLPIQRRIAEILDAADALRRKDQELLQKYDELAQAIFIDMFGDPVKNEKGWEVIKLDDLLLKGEKISYGVVQPGDNFPDGVPIIRVGDFKLMKIDKINLKRIDPEIEKSYSRTRLKGDEILIACVGSVGKIALADESLKGFNIVRATAKVRVDANLINRTYLAFHLSQKSIQNYFVAETRTSSQPTLNIKQIEETKILVPPIKIQNQFNLLSDDLLKQIDLLISTNTETLFQTLLQKAFKGELEKE